MLEVSIFPGVHAGGSTGVQVDVWAGVCCAGDAGGAAAGGLVLIEGAGAADSKGDPVPAGVNGEGVGGSVSRAGAGGLVAVAKGAGVGAGGVAAAGATGAS